MRRREFIGLIGGAAAWPLAARAQQPARMRRVAVVMLYPEGDLEGQARATAFRQSLESAGWELGRNVAVDYLWGAFNSDWTSKVTAELQRQAPDVIVLNSGTGLRAIESAAAGIPIVFVAVSEPVAQGLVASLSHPGGNVTGFSNLEPTLGAKWFDLLKEIAPAVRRIEFMYNPGNPGARVTLKSIQAAAQKFSVEVVDAQVTDLSEIEAAVASVGRQPDGALVLPPDPFLNSHRKRIVELATSYKLPTVSGLRSFVVEGGLLAYGISIPNLFSQAAGYVDRILRGDKPADMPVQQPTKFEMVINVKAAKELGLDVSPMLIARADEVIE